MKTDIKITPLMPIDEALQTVLKHINTLPAEEIHITEALNRILAEDMYADINIPQRDNTAMDGYAVRAADTRGASASQPEIFDVVDDVRAGEISSRIIQEKQAIRIMTGAVIPDGADSVIIVEDTERDGKHKVKVFKETSTADNVRKVGEDIKEGELVLKRGTRLNSARIGILASLGRSTFKVTRRPKVAVLATGDEIIDVDDTLEPGKLRSSNTYTLYNQILTCGGIPKNLGIAHDKPEELEEKISQGMDCDLILTSGGVSVGDYDLVKYILAKMGTDVKFWRVAIKPGKPLVFGMIKGIPLLGLPGNPVSSMITFEVFVRPALLKMIGHEQETRNEVDAVLEEDLHKKKGIRYFLRAQTRWEDGIYLTHTIGPQGSGILKSMAYANSLIILSEEDDFIGKGTRVTVRFLE